MHTHCFMHTHAVMMVWLTVGAVLVDLCVGVNLNCGSLRNLRNLSFKSGVNHQVVVLINAFELLRDSQPFPAWLEGHVDLTSELSAWQTGQRGSVRLDFHQSAQQTTQTDVSKQRVRWKYIDFKRIFCHKKYLLYSGSFALPSQLILQLPLHLTLLHYKFKCFCI